MNIGYYSIDNTDTNSQIPSNDYSTNYNVIDRFQSVLSNPKIHISDKNIKWENISNVVVDATGRSYYLLKLEVSNSTYLKFIIVDVEGKLLIQRDIDNAFKKLNLTQRNFIHLLGKERNTLAIIINDNDKLYRYYYALKESNKNISGLEISSLNPKYAKRDSKDNYYHINTNSIPYEPRLSTQGSNLYALIYPSNDKTLPSNFPCLLNINVNNQKVTESCSPINNSDVYQFLPSLQANTEDNKEDTNFDFATDYNVFSSPIDKTVEDPSILSYIGTNLKLQRFDWSSPNFYYITDDAIGFYRRNKDVLKSSVEWQILSNNLPPNFVGSNADFVAYSNKNRHIFICIKENDQNENGHIAIIDIDARKINEDNNVSCTKKFSTSFS